MMNVISNSVVSVVRRLASSALRPFGLQVVGTGSGEIAAFDPLDRNKKEMLDALWSDRSFLDQYYNDNKKGLYSSVIEFCKVRGVLGGQSQRIADVGCGPGYFTRSLIEGGFGDTVVGYDFSEAGVKAARSNCPSASFYVHEITEPFPETFDVLFCMETLEHLLRPAIALKNLLAHSKVTVLTVPEGRKDTFRGHINFWSKESWDIFIQDTSGERKILTAEINDGANLLAIIGPA